MELGAKTLHKGIQDGESLPFDQGPFLRFIISLGEPFTIVEVGIPDSNKLSDAIETYFGILDICANTGN